MAKEYAEHNQGKYTNVYQAFLAGAEFGYNKAKEDVKHDLMIKLKDEGIVKPLKDSILRNERLNNQEQQELCAWIECAMDFGENLDECAKELEEAKKANEWHFVKDGDLPNTETKNYTYIRRRKRYERQFTDYRVIKCFVLCLNEKGKTTAEVGYFDCSQKCFLDNAEGMVYAWKEIVLPEESKQ